MNWNKTKNLMTIILILGFLIIPYFLNTRTNTVCDLSIPKTSIAHTPIDIEGNTEMDAFFSGDGTDGLSWETAHIIADYTINGTGSTCAINIIKTDRYLIIKDCFVFREKEAFVGTLFLICIALKNCENIRILSNKISNPDGYAIHIRDGSANITVSNNRMDNCAMGIALKDSSHNRLSKNTISSANFYGIQLIGNCDNNIITENIINNCEDGAIYLDYNSDYNEVYKNCLQNNELTIDDRSNNNNCYDNDYCPGIPGYSIFMVLGALLGATMLILSVIHKRVKRTTEI